jgi:hypothetical protein
MDLTVTPQGPAYLLRHTLFIPAHVSSLEYTQNETLILGSGESFRARAEQATSDSSGRRREYPPLSPT